MSSVAPIALLLALPASLSGAFPAHPRREKSYFRSLPGRPAQPDPSGGAFDTGRVSVAGALRGYCASTQSRFSASSRHRWSRVKGRSRRPLVNVTWNSRLPPSLNPTDDPAR